MKIDDLRPDEGAKKKRKRVGRGISAGQGKTAGRGTKGQGARSGGGKGPYFEGGQLPLVRRLPFKKGFNPPYRINYQEINVGELSRRFEKGTQLNPQVLAEAGLIGDPDAPVVILGDGELTVALNVQAQRFTGTARAKIEGAGGTAEVIEINPLYARTRVRKLRKEQLAELAEKSAGEQA